MKEKRKKELGYVQREKVRIEKNTQRRKERKFNEAIKDKKRKQRKENRDRN